MPSLRSRNAPNDVIFVTVREDEASDATLVAIEAGEVRVDDVEAVAACVEGHARVDDPVQRHRRLRVRAGRTRRPEREREPQPAREPVRARFERGSGNRAHDPLIVEGPEVFQRAATARYHHHVSPLGLTEIAKPAHYVFH